MKKALEYIRQQKLIEKGDHVVAGVSGGADSVYLLFLLLKYKEETDFKISVVHVHHNLRGAEADRDARYVGKLCSQYELPFELVSVDVKKLAADRKISTEEAGRLARYEVFENCCRTWGATKIALAHHQNDLAETMIYHLVRGTGMKGLVGIRSRRGKIIRPLLGMKRQEIEHYLNENNIKYVTDSTNQEDDYTRNKIRHHVVEYLEKEVNAQTVAHMAETSAELDEVQTYLEKQAEQLYRQHVQDQDTQQIISEKLFDADIPAFLQNLVIRRCIYKITGSLKDFTRIHLNAVRELSEKQVGKQVRLPSGLTAKRGYEQLCIRRDRELEKKQEHEEVCPDGTNQQEQDGRGKRDWQKRKEEGGDICAELTVPGVQKIGNMQISCILEENKHQIIPEKSYTKWLNYDKINDKLVLRTRKPGDFLVVNRNGGRKKLKDYLIDCKIPREERDQILLLCAGSEVLWVIGYRISEAYKVLNDTESVLKIQIQGGTVHE